MRLKVPGEAVSAEVVRLVLNHPLELVFVEPGHPGAAATARAPAVFLAASMGAAPRNLRVLETIRRLLDEHPLQEFVDRLPAVAEVAAVVVSALDAAVPFARRRQADHGPQLPDVLQGRLAFRDRLAQVPDRLVLAVSLHER